MSQPLHNKYSFFLVRKIFIKAMGVIYLIAFVSMAVQIIGLIGQDGILPITKYFDALREHYGRTPFFDMPSVFWISSSDIALRSVCFLGIASAAAVIAGLAPAVGLVVCWILYLSLLHGGQTFMTFQWDILLLEVGLLSIFFAPWQILPAKKKEEPLSVISLWLLRWVLFRLMFESGLVKLYSGDETWKSLTALTYHYFTQPLPNPISWYVHQMPVWFHKISCALMFFIELIVPFFIFMGRKGRLIAFGPLVALQVLILFTGNYNFFNLLAITLCLLCLDDQFIRRWILRKKTTEGSLDESPPLWRPKLATKRILVSVLAVTILVVTGGFFMRKFTKKPQPKPVFAVMKAMRPFASINSYGLFAVMTTKRREILIEGSNDLRTWQAYEFRWKPGDPKRIPGQVAPHQPRLDWQMWFAALRNYRSSRWFLPFMKKLLEGSEDVSALLEHNPFEKSPPKYIRAKFYDYTFTDGQQRKATGAWWQRKYLGLYAPALNL